MELIKLIWDFRHVEAEKMAEHHVKHLREFIDAKGVANSTADFELIMSNYSIAFIITTKDNMILFRDALKPNRGEYVES